MLFCFNAASILTCPQIRWRVRIYKKILNLNTISIMNRQIIIEKTMKILNQLPEEKAEAISDFADFILKRYEEHILTAGIQQIVSKSNSFNFLQEEEETYSLSDLKEVYNA